MRGDAEHQRRFCFGNGVQEAKAVGRIGCQVVKFPYAIGQVHNEILYAGKQMGMIGMGLYLGFGGAVTYNPKRSAPLLREQRAWAFFRTICVKGEFRRAGLG